MTKKDEKWIQECFIETVRCLSILGKQIETNESQIKKIKKQLKAKELK